MSRRNLYLLLAGIAITWLCYNKGEQDPYARYLRDGYQKIDALALDDVPDELLFEGAMEGMVNVLKERGDPYSELLEPQAAKRMGEELSQEFGGIGVVLEYKEESPGYYVAHPPLPGLPADRAGIRSGDQIIAIDGFSTAGLTLDDFEIVLRRMRGKPRKPLNLVIRRPEVAEPLSISLERELIEQPSIAGDIPLEFQKWKYTLEEDERIALVRLMSFGDKTAGEIESLIPQLVDEGIRGLILDVRRNPGGRLDSAIDVCRLFLPAGELIVETHGRGNQVLDSVVTSRDGPFKDIPLVVLVDRDSASASELVAGCLKDTGRAVVCGERSYGKGTVQQLLYMQSGNRMLKLTSASFWTKGGNRIQRLPGADRWGVDPSPELEVTLTDEQHGEWLLARRERDRPTTGARSPSDSDQPAERLFVDEAVDRAVAHLQHQLDHE
jgi:carboxyl-terminal processing protease